MRTRQLPQILWAALFIEIGFGLICLLATHNFVTLLFMFVVLGFLAGIGLISKFSGLWTGEMFEQMQPHQPNFKGPRPSGFQPNRPGGPWNIGPLNINFNGGTERTEAMEQTIPLSAELNAVNVSVSNGAIKLTGREGLEEIKIKAVRRIWTNDESSIRAEFDRLLLRHRMEGATLRIEAGDPEQGVVIGKGGRIDLEIELPAAMTVTMVTSTGEIGCKSFHGDLTARTTFGNMNIEGYNSGRNISLTTTSGKINLNTVAAGLITIKAGAGVINLAAVGAERLELESTAGSVTSRGVNCGTYVAKTTTGNVEVHQAHVEFGLDLRTNAGRIYADQIETPAFHFDATSGAIFYQGNAPKSPSEVANAVGSVQLVLKAGSNFNLDARSNVGTVDTALPVNNVRVQTRNAFEGQVGTGGSLLKVRTQVGTIRVGLG